MHRPLRNYPNFNILHHYPQPLISSRRAAPINLTCANLLCKINTILHPRRRNKTFLTLPTQHITTMASTSQAPSFPSRPYSSTMHGKLPERAGPGPSFGASSRENARIERERQERERAAQQAQSQQQQQHNPGPSIANITDEQKEEISEAVCSCTTCPISFSRKPGGSKC